MQARCLGIRGLILFTILGLAAIGASQQNLPQLEQLRLAAEKGDPVAEHNFGEVFLSQGNCSTAFEWFQKAAKQGNRDSQYRLGQMLMDGRPKTQSSKAAVPKETDEALR
jgi:TPR repeat protein